MPNILEFDTTYCDQKLEHRVYAHANCVPVKDEPSMVAELIQFGARCRHCGAFLSGRFLNVYTTERFFGGHEEGGWWITNYEPVGCVRVSDASKVEEVLEFLRLSYSDVDKVAIEEDSRFAYPHSTPTSYS